MNRSSDIALLFNVAELAKRFGMRPSEAEAVLDFVTDEDESNPRFELRFPGGTKEKADNIDKMLKLLGCSSDGLLVARELSELEDIVDRALTLAPRARSI